MHILGQNSTRRRRRKLRPAWDRLDDRCLLSGLTPARGDGRLRADAITFTSPNGSTVKGDGAGETIALIEAYHDPTIASDLKTFDQSYGLPNPALTGGRPGGQRDRRRLGTRGIARCRVGSCHRAGRQHPGGGSQLADAEGV